MYVCQQACCPHSSVFHDLARASHCVLGVLCVLCSCALVQPKRALFKAPLTATGGAAGAAGSVYGRLDATTLIFDVTVNHKFTPGVCESVPWVLIP